MFAQLHFDVVLSSIISKVFVSINSALQCNYFYYTIGLVLY